MSHFKWTRLQNISKKYLIRDITSTIAPLTWLRYFIFQIYHNISYAGVITTAVWCVQARLSRSSTGLTSYGAFVSAHMQIQKRRNLFCNGDTRGNGLHLTAKLWNQVGKPKENPQNSLNTSANRPAWIKEASECGGGAFSFSFLRATTGATGEQTHNADVILRSRTENRHSPFWPAHQEDMHGFREKL